MTEVEMVGWHHQLDGSGNSNRGSINLEGWDGEGNGRGYICMYMYTYG